MLVKTEAVVLHSFKYGENRLIADLFTREHGRLSFIMNIPKTSKGRLKKQLFQPLSLIDVECDLRPNVQLQHLRDARMLDPFSSIPFEPAKLAISLFIAEFLYHALRGERESDPQLFDYMTNSIRWLDAATTGYANFHLAFLMRLSRFLGFYPLIKETSAKHLNSNGAQEGAGAYFDLRAGTFCSEVPQHHDFLAPEEAAHIHTMMRMDFQTMHLFRMNRNDRNRCLDIMLTYYQLHLPDFPELKSLPVLQELFRET